MRRRAFLLPAAALAAALVPTIGAKALGPPPGPPVVPPSATPPAAIGMVGPANEVASFSGAVQNPTPLPLVNPPAPAVCAVNCQEFTVNLLTRDPVLVSLKNTVTGPGGTFNPNDGFDLYVYGPNGRLVAAANGIGANGQALAVNSPQPGMYTLVVTFSYAEDANAAYQGEVRLLSAPAWQPPACTDMVIGSVNACFQLPQLRALPAYDLAVSGLPPVASTPLGFPLPVSAPTSNSCYVDESLGLDNPSVAGLEQPVTRCLRFTSDVQDVGAGGVVVRIPLARNGSGGPTSGYLPGQCKAQQVLSTSDGRQVTRPAGPCEFHPQHAHFHYKDLLSYGLYQVAPGGGVGALVSRSQKESFCLADDDYFGFATPGPNGPRQFVGQPGCNLPSKAGPSGAYVDEGISPGWGDVYTWDTPDQFIDISQVPPGVYDIVEMTNPSGHILVAGAPQTCALTQLQLTATSVNELSSQPSVPCPG